MRWVEALLETPLFEQPRQRRNVWPVFDDTSPASKAKGPLIDADYRVEKMRFAKKKDPDTGKNVDDRSTVIYNTKITLRGIPEAAWEYVVNGKVALDWVVERQAVRVDKASGIINDANDWAAMGNPRYSLELFQRVVTVTLETQRIVNLLSRLDILEYSAHASETEPQQRIGSEVEVPPGYWIDYGGTFEQFNLASQRLSVVVPVTLAIIFALLFWAFGSAKDAAIVFSGVPWRSLVV